MNNKILNLNKYSFLNWLKGDIFVWLTCNENYQLAAKESKQLEKLTPWRFINQEQENKEEHEEIKDMPDQMTTGIDVGDFALEWAKASYSDHKLVVIDKHTNLENVEYTKQFLDSDEDYIIAEATFGYNEFYIRTDILIKTGTMIKIVEVKAVTAPFEIHAWDLFFQKAIIEKNNYIEWGYTLLILNSMYEHNPNLSDSERALKLFIETPIFLTLSSKPGSKNGIKWTMQDQLTYSGYGIGEVSEDANIVKTRWESFIDFFEDFDRTVMIDKFDEILQKIKTIQLLDKPPISGLEKRNWDYMKSDYMPWSLYINGVTQEDSIFDLRNFKVIKKLELWNDLKIKTINDAPLYLISPKSHGIVEGEETQKYIDKFLKFSPFDLKYKTLFQKHFINSNEKMLHIKYLKLELDKYKKGPIYMYDFETANLAMPKVKYTHPYQQVPYQFSIHIITNPNDFDFVTMKNIKHIEWIAKDRETFHQEFWKAFSEVFLKFGEGTYVSWNMSFEKSVIQNIDDTLVSQEGKIAINKVLEETVDLEDPFKYKMYYHRDLHGSSSIKAVGPHFAPDINYKNLNVIQKGDESSAQAKKWLRSESKEGDIEWASIRKDMLKYCGYDTLLMVAILQRLKEEVEKND